VQRLRALIDHVDAIAEIPNSLRHGTAVRLHLTNVATTGALHDADWLGHRVTRASRQSSALHLSGRSDARRRAPGEISTRCRSGGGSFV
jgi:hypothetical protein